MADNNPAETYRLAYKELLQETNQVQSRIGKLEEIASLLSGRAWQKITFSTGGGQVIGIGMRKVTTKPVLLSDLPKADDLHQRITEWQRKYDNCERLYSNLSQEDKQTLPPPGNVNH